MALSLTVNYPRTEADILDRASGEGIARTGTGLDLLLDMTLADQGLNRRVRDGEITEAVTAMAEMNAMIVEAIHQTGIAADGDISAAETYSIADYIKAHFYEPWIVAHGDDEGSTETGFHLVQNDGATTRLFGENGVNRIADGLYHLGFGYDRGRLINEDGNRNVEVEDVAFWLNALLQEDLANGVFDGPAPAPIAQTGTGLDALVAMVQNDQGLNNRLPLSEINAGAEAANTMNQAIVDGIRALGLANDGTLTAANVTALSDWIQENRAESFTLAHGNDEQGVETGFHLVQNDGANTRLFGENGVNTVADGIYHLVFGYDSGRLINEDGNRNASLEDVADWLNRLLADDFEDLANPDVSEVITGTTGTGLDRLVDLIVSDPGLTRNVSANDIEGGATAANTMNEIIVEGIETLGLGEDGVLSAAEIYQLSDWIGDTHRDAFTEAHGDDEGNEETGFHLVQNDGAEGDMFGRNTVNTIADGIYHLVFGYRGDRLINEDGNRNARVEEVAFWLNELLHEDLQSWRTAQEGPVGTGLEQLVDIIAGDVELHRRVPLDEILDGMEAAQQMNAIIVEAIQATGVAFNGRLSAGDVMDVADWINENRFDEWLVWHGDDEAGIETGFHLVQNDGAISRLYAQNAINTVADGIYHLGFGHNGRNIINEDGNRNASLTDLAYWMTDLLADDLASGALNGAENIYDVADTGTGLDALTQAIFDDPVLMRSFATSDLVQAAEAMNDLSALLLQGIDALGLANDGEFTGNDIILLNDWIAENVLEEWNALNGADNRNADGFRMLRGEGATIQVDGFNAVDSLARTLFSLGNGIRWGTSVYDQDGRWTATVDQAASYLNALLAEDLESGALFNDAFAAVDPSLFADSQVAALDGPIMVGDGAGSTQIAHSDALELSEGAIAISFTPDSLDGWHKRMLVSKDHRGYEDGGHTSVWIADGRVHVRVQDEDQSWTLSSPHNMLISGNPADVVLNFGPGGIELWLDGERVAQNSEAIISWENNDNPLAIGESRFYARNDDLTNYDLFDGEITSVQVYDRTLTQQEVAGLDREEAGPRVGAAVDLGDSAAGPRQGDGLTGQVYDWDGWFRSITDMMTRIEEGSLTATHEISVGHIDFEGRGRQSLDDFLGEGGSVTSGDASVAVERMGITLNGYIWIEEGEHTFTVSSDDGFALHIGGEEFMRHAAPRANAPTSATQTFEAGLYEIEIFYFENGGQQALQLALDGQTVPAANLFASVEDYLNAGAYDPAQDATPTTGTGLDTIVEWVETDSGLLNRTTGSERDAGAQAAHEMNKIILEAITALGAGDDGHLTVGEVYDIATWINENRFDEWLVWHGDDEQGVETGFHLVQNDGAQMRAFGDAAINTVADGIYHLGFGFDNGRLINEDGNRNASVEDVAHWLNELLAEDLASGSLSSGNDAEMVGTTGTGLDRLIDMAVSDPELLRRIPEEEMREATEAMDVMNTHIRDGIEALGLANDGVISGAEVAGLSDWIQENHQDSFTVAHGDDEAGVETGFHLVQNDGAVTRYFAQNAINTVADGIYHLVFGYENGRLINEDGNRNATLNDVGAWLTNLLSGDMEELANASVIPVPLGDTGTGLDSLVSGVATDVGLHGRIPLADIIDGAEAANAMNHMIIDSIVALGYANDGILSESEVRGLAAYMQDTYNEGPESVFALAHGNDEQGVETGFHLVQNDGAEQRLFNENLVNTVADGIYHLGFGTNARGDRLINEDGNNNQRISDIADWLNALLEDDMADLVNPDMPAFSGTTGTGLDAFVSIIMDDIGLNQNVSIGEMTEGAQAANSMNEMILDGIRSTGIAQNGSFNAADIRLLSDYMQVTYNAEENSPFAVAHGDDENGVETGFHLVQNDGASLRIFGENAVNTVLDGIYHLGFGYTGGRLINEDGNRNATLDDVAYWLETALSTELTDGSLVTDASPGPYVMGSTGTGLDQLVEIITQDDELGLRLSTPEIAEAAASADQLNTWLLEAIRETDVAADGRFTVEDMKDLSLYLQETHGDAWAEQHGSNSGFDLARHAQSSLFDRTAIADVADGLYNLGFGFRWDRVTHENGNTDVRLSEVADWLEDLLSAELEAGSLTADPLTSSDFSDTPVVAVTNLAIGGTQDAVAASSAAGDGTIVVTFTSDSASSGDRQVLVSRASHYDENGRVDLVIDNGRLEAEIYQNGRWITMHSGNMTLQDGEQYTAAFSFDDTQMSLYLNGTKVDLELDDRIDASIMSGDMLIGSDSRINPWNDQEHRWHAFDGTIYSVEVYDRVLTNAEVAYLNDSGLYDLSVEAGAATMLADTALVPGDGLNADVFDFDGSLRSISQLKDRMEDAEADLSFVATQIDYSSANNSTIAEFVEYGASDMTGDGSAVAEVFGVHMDGFIFVEEGTHTFDIRTDDGFALEIGGQVVSQFAGLRAPATSEAEITFAESGYYSFELHYFENRGAQVLEIEMNGETLDSSVLYTDSLLFT